MRASAFVFLGALLLCACAREGDEVPAGAGEPAGRVLEPLPAPPRPEVDPEAMPGAGDALAVVAAHPQGVIGGDVRPTITFSRPVVALESIEAGERRPPPARIDPGIPGTWRWIGSSAVEFVPDRQLPMATAFRVTVPAGLTALDGARLDAPFEFHFSTPAPEVQRIEPPPGHRWLPARPRFSVIFNQPVADLAAGVRLEVEGVQQPVALRVVEEVDLVEELRAREEGRRYARMEADPIRSQQRRYVLEAAADLPRDRAVTLVFNGDLRGAQGPLVLGHDRREPYRTWGDMAIVGVQACIHDGTCSWGPVILRTSNRAVVDGLRERLVVEPPVEIDWDRVEAHLPPAWGELQEPWIALPGRWRPGTTYRISVRAGLADEFGQGAGAFEGTVRLDDRPPAFDTGGEIALLERDGDGALPIETVNLPDVDVTVWRLDPAEMARALALWGDLRRPRGAPARVFRLDTSATPNETRRTPLDVRGAIGGDGLFAVRIASDLLPQRGAELVIGQITDLAVHARLGATSGVVWVTRLSSGLPVADAAIAVRDRSGAVRWRGRADAEGIARLPGMAELIPAEDASYRWDAPHALVTAELDGELGATLSTWTGPLSPAAFDLPMAWDGAHRRSLGLVFSDRGIYRPGDTVHAKGVARVQRLGRLERPPEGTPVRLVLRSPRGDEVAQREAQVGPYGTFHADFVVPADAPLGTWSLAASATLDEEETLHWGGTFRVEEYRAPHFQVDVGLAADELSAGDPLRGDVLARYLFGGAMADAQVRWSLARTSIDFRPPGNEGFAFGANTWWWDDGRPAPTREIVGGGQGRTDAQGALALTPGVAEAPAGRTWRYTLEAEVEDVDRQRVAGRAEATVHPASAYAGVRLARAGFAEAGEPVPIELLAVRPDGSRVEGAKLALRIQRRTWQSIRRKGVGGHWYTESEPVEEEVGRCEVRSARTPARCTFTPAEPGFYVLEAQVTDEAGRTQTTRDSFHAVGRGWVSWQRNDTDRIDLVADRAVYAPGETARILVKSPWPEAEALLTVERSGVISARRVKLDGAATTLEVPIDEAAIPNVFVGVLLVRGRVEEGGIDSGADPGRPAVRVGYTELKVEEAARRLAVEVEPDAQEKRPGDRVRVRLQARGHDGRGAPAELTVWAVDEAVLRLTGYEAPDLVEAMYPRQGLSVRIGEPLLHLVQRHLYGEKGETAGGGGGEGAGGALRTRFRTTVLFAPTVETDAEGRAEVEFELPDNLTTFRILAVAVGRDDRFGAGTASVRVARPLLALPALPRVARVGDRFEAGVVLHGHRFSAPEVQVRAEAEGLAIDGPATRTVSVVEGRPVEVRFPFVARTPGTAVLRFHVAGGGERDGVEQKIPVKLPVAMEAVAAYGDTTGEVVEGLAPPAGARQDVGGLELGLASTALGGYDENFDQLVDYPWGCLEQQASRLVPFVALRDLAGTFGVPWKEAQAAWIAPEALAANGSTDPDEVVRRTVAAIERLQNPDGGYRYWPSSPCSSHHASAWAVWALARAKEVGYPVDAAALARGQAYLADVVAAGQCERCGWGCEAPPDAVRVMALWTLARTGAPRPSWLPALHEARAKLPLFAKALLADAMYTGGGDRAAARKLLQEILNHAKESPGGVHFEERDPRTWAPLWSSDVRTTAIVLGLLATVSPDHPWVGKIARWLGTARGSDGRWDSTQEAAWALTALVEVVRGRERETPAFDATVRLAGEPLFSRRFEGRSMEIAKAEVPMARLQAAGAGALTIGKAGPGVLYYGARLHYAPTEMPTTPLDRGFVVQRWFEPWEGGGQARRFFAGELVRVRVRVASNQERHYAVIEVPLPAGLEPVDVRLASTASQPQRPSDEGFAPGYEWESAEDLHGDRPPEGFTPWARAFYSPFNHTELRDDRVVLFADRLPPGVHTASFVARATTPGDFSLPPARAEEMYAPEVFGRSDGGRFEVRATEAMAAR